MDASQIMENLQALLLQTVKQQDEKYRQEAEEAEKRQDEKLRKSPTGIPRGALVSTKIFY